MECEARLRLASVTVSNGTRMTEEARAAGAERRLRVGVVRRLSAAAPAYIRASSAGRAGEAVRMVQRGHPAHIIPTVHAKNVDDLASCVQLSRDLGASLNFSLLTCEPDDEVLGGLLPGADEAHAGRALLTLTTASPFPRWMRP
ncbi:MAG: hypothetical protein ACLSVD_07000 [Eggerthellaceae bacterium]